MRLYKTVWEECVAEETGKNTFFVQNLERMGDLRKQAAENRPSLRYIGNCMAEHYQARFIIAKNKTRAAARASLIKYSKYYCYKDPTPNYLTDYLRGTLLFKTLDDIRRFRTDMMDLTENGTSLFPDIVSIRDRYACYSESGLRGIFLEVRTSSGHICEIQGHLEAYWKGLQHLHPLYKKTIALGIQEEINSEENGFSYVYNKRVAKLARLAERTNVNALFAANPGEQDCSWPYRKILKPETREKVWFRAKKLF